MLHLTYHTLYPAVTILVTCDLSRPTSSSQWKNVTFIFSLSFTSTTGPANFLTMKRVSANLDMSRFTRSGRKSPISSISNALLMSLCEFSSSFRAPSKLTPQFLPAASSIVFGNYSPPLWFPLNATHEQTLIFGRRNHFLTQPHTSYLLCNAQSLLLPNPLNIPPSSSNNPT